MRPATRSKDLEDLELPPGIDVPPRAAAAVVAHTAALHAATLGQPRCTPYLVPKSSPATAASSTAPIADRGGRPLSRCWPSADAQVTAGDSRGDAWICRAWANGACAQGAACTWLHRLPGVREEQRIMYSTDGLEYDIFGRARHAAFDSSAVALGHNPLTADMLRVAGLPARAAQREIRALLFETFSEWGTVVRTWAGAQLGTGYVRFKMRCSAQFVLEAMHGRPASPEESSPLQLSFALTDPEKEIAAAGRSLAMRSMEEAKRRRDAQQDMYEQLEREAKAAKQAASTASFTKPPIVSDAPRAAGEPSLAASGVAAINAWVETPPRPMSAVTSEYPGASIEDVICSAGGEGCDGITNADTELLPHGWVRGIDPTSGYCYFYHTATCKSQWERPDAAT
mmetsp:Transcript_12879/g.29664  ORF Transcript_12879/g.29664 Transcript_12879/m.29664 type:complete len:398 (-) Transcript_12879:228-1421(-)